MAIPSAETRTRRSGENCRSAHNVLFLSNRLFRIDGFKGIEV